MPLIFASGSLLNPDSISKTINRKVNFTDMYPTEIKNYTRTWTALSKIQLDSDKIGFLRDALFVDLSKSTKGCNGALIEISDYELELLKIREHCYEVVKIIATLNYNEVDALAFIIPDKTKSRKA